MMKKKAVVLLLLAGTGATAQQYCGDPDPTTRIVTCTIPGPAAGTFVFPPGVSQYTLVSMSSGNGGAATFDTNANFKSVGGKGAQTSGLSTLPVTGEGLRYFVGANGRSSNFPINTRVQLVLGPPLSGSASSSGTGGGPSFILDAFGNALLSLGAGGGGSSSGNGGAAGFGPTFGQYYAGENGKNGNQPSQTTFGFGGGSSLNSPGSGGVGSVRGRPGQLDGNGGDSCVVDYYVCAGGGGSITGAGGGGGNFGAGGGGNSYSGISGVSIVQRSDAIGTPPSLVFEYVLPSVLSTTTLVAPTATATTTSTMATVTSAVTEFLTLTQDVSSTTQDPLSTSIVTAQTVSLTTFTGRRTKAKTSVSTTVTLQATATALTTATAAPTCIRYQASYPASCCPAQYRAMQRIDSTVARRRLDLAERAVEKRTGSALTSSIVTPSPFENTATVTPTFTTTEISPAPTETLSFTSYTPTVTSTLYFNSAADTTTVTEFSTDVSTRTAVPGLTLTVVDTLTSFSTVATATSTVSAQPTACATQNAYTITQCPTDNTQLQRFKKDQLGALYQLKDQSSAAGSGSQILVNCGSAGTYLF